MNHLDCKLGWMKQQARIFASDASWVTTSANVPNLKAWYRADTTINAGGFVSQLTDKSGNGFHLVQATGSKQPALNTSDANMGGRDSITFDGTDDALTMASPGYGSMSGMTLFIVTRSCVAAASPRMFTIGNANVAQSVVVILLSVTDARPSFFYANPSNTFTERRSDLAANQAFYTSASPAVISASFDSSAAAANAWATRTRLGAPQTANQTSSATQSVVASQAVGLGSNQLGTSQYAAFTLAELILCDAALTADQMRKIELYLAGYYGLL